MPLYDEWWYNRCMIIMQKERLRYLDLGAGVMILYMMIGHALQAQFSMEAYGVLHGIIWPWLDMSHIRMVRGIPIAEYRDALYPFLHFYMAWFFYKSGQFFSKRGSMDLLRGDSSKLLRVFVIWSAIGYVFYISLLGMRGALTLRAATLGVAKTFVLHGNIPLNYPLWFLFTLFLVRQLANIVLPAKSSKSFIPVCALVVCVAYLLSFLLWKYHTQWLPYYIANSIVGLMFFTLGYCISQYETQWWLCLPCIVGYIACYIWGFSIVQYFPNTLHAGHYLLNMPTALCGIVTFNVICRLVVKYVPQIIAPFEIVAKNAMILYVAHGLLYVTISEVILKFEIVRLMPYAFSLMIAAYVMLLPGVCILYNRIKKNGVGIRPAIS